MFVGRLGARVLRLGFAIPGVRTLAAPPGIFEPGVVDILGYLLLVHRMHLAEVLAEDDPGREERLARDRVRELAVAEIVAHAAADAGPLLVERGNCKQVGDI